MIRSMTGFGQAGRTVNGYRLQADLKSVNHRYAEIAVRMPREWLVLEDAVRRTVQSFVKRGRVDVFVTIERETAADKTVEVDWSLLEGYRQAAEQLRTRLGLTDPLRLRDVLALPELISFREAGADADAVRMVEEALIDCVREAAGHLVRMRETEGAHLAKDLAERLDRLEQLHREACRAAPLVVEECRAKLHQRLTELLGDKNAILPDDPRLMMEVALLAERSAIDEELTRLESHFAQCRQLLRADEPVGRKLDFLIQEMNREANTIGSKANRLELVNRVVDMKAELEKMREQVQNIE